jgi:hypothetical protein
MEPTKQVCSGKNEGEIMSDKELVPYGAVAQEVFSFSAT